ncbi:MAG TPA: CatB-related O-acetyltransferase [Bacteroidia bacterium]|jgi:virginiamycin A acetyltransferase|nr:CatB-related O-acetyltransferase [Bacteroidia bacterium]
MSFTQYIWRQLVRLKNPSCSIGNGIMAKDIVFGKRVTIEPGSYIGAQKIGKYTFIGMNSYVDKSTASIGSFCSIAMNARISLNNHPLDRVTTHPFTYHKKYGFVNESEKIAGINDKKTVIGNDVWIGANVTILAGATIGDGAVLGANSLVTKDVEPYSIVNGSPAAHIRFRFDETTVKKLQQSQWWNWEDEKIKKHLAEFRKPEDFIKML